jgi:class 3 adenylate cyclase
MCFLDITGYTRLTQEQGDEAGARLAEKLARLVQ